MTDKLRNTGRTSRMLIEATRLAALGNGVAVIAANHHSADRMLSQAFNDIDTTVVRLIDITCNTRTLTITFPTGYIWFIPMDSGNIDWDRGGKLNGTNCQVLIDHAVLEFKYQWVLKEMHRFDANAVPDGGPASNISVRIDFDSDSFISGLKDALNRSVRCRL